MQTLMVDFIISLDGYGAAEGWPGFWGMEGPEYLGWLEEQEEHTALMGAATYRLMSGFAAQTPDEAGMAELTALPKVVFSASLEGPLSWPNTELVSGDAVDAVRAMKEQGHRPLRTLGSLALSRSSQRRVSSADRRCSSIPRCSSSAKTSFWCMQMLLGVGSRASIAPPWSCLYWRPRVGSSRPVLPGW